MLKASMHTMVRTPMAGLRRILLGTMICTTLAAGVVIAAQRGDKPSKESSKEQEAKRPKISMRANPQVVIAPARVTISVELSGGADDFEEYYCPTVVWEWGDDTSSESTTDCEPYEAGKSQIKRRYTTQHQFRRPGNFKLSFHLKNKERVLASASTTVQVQPGLQNGPF